MTRSKARGDLWMPLWIDDWEAATAHLSCEEDGAYGRLVRWYFRNGPPPDDDAALARIVRMDARAWRRARSALAAFFDVGEGVWRHKRVDAERAAAEARMERFKDRARRGGEAKAARGRAASGVLEADDKHRKSRPSSTPEAVLDGCLTTGESEEDHQGSSSDLSDSASARPSWPGPADVRKAFVVDRGEAWARSYIDPCRWSETDRALIPATAFAGGKIVREARSVLKAHELTVMEHAHG